MKSFFKKYTVPVVALICVLALCGAWTGVRLSAGAGTYRLDDIEGDASYLNGIRIDMSLSDAAHTQAHHAGQRHDQPFLYVYDAFLFALRVFAF